MPTLYYGKVSTGGSASYFCDSAVTKITESDDKINRKNEERETKNVFSHHPFRSRDQRYDPKQNILAGRAEPAIRVNAMHLRRELTANCIERLPRTI
jgi:hypothetical protein